jgi:hypothetical protein
MTRYDRYDGMNGADCNLPPMVPCTMSDGWPTRESYIQACTRHQEPVGWLEWPIECGGQGVVVEGELPAGPDPGHGGHGKSGSVYPSSQKRGHKTSGKKGVAHKGQMASTDNHSFANFIRALKNLLASLEGQDL